MNVTINKAVKRYHLPRLFVLVCMLSSVFSLLTPPQAFAAKQTLRVSPVIMQVPLSPGKTITQEVTVENLTTAPLPLRASLNDFVTGGEEGGYVFENAKTNPLLSWIKLSDETFLLNPHEKKHITMTIAMPASIPVGGYYGILFFEPVLQTASTQATQVSTRVGVLMLGNLGVPDNGKQKADIITFSPAQISQDGTVPFLLRVQNISLNFFTAKPIITLTPLIGNPQSQKPIYLEEKLIFPDKVRRWTEDQTIHDLSPNIYKIHLAVSTGNGAQIVSEKFLLVLPFTKIIIGMLILFVIIVLTIKRKRLRRAVKELFRP